MLHVLVCQGEQNARYRQFLEDSELARFRFCATEADISAALEQADAIFASMAFPRELLAKAPRLRWVHVAAAGVDRFIGCWLPADVLLTRSDVSFGDSIAEYVLGHCLAHGQRLREVFDLQRRKEWKPLELMWLQGKTIGIAGPGSIGRTVADRAAAMRMRVVGYARTPRDIAGFAQVFGPGELLEFLSEVDILVICLPLTPETRGLIGARELASMKHSALLVNVARGAIVDEGALVDALRGKRIEAAVLDVFEREPLPKSSPLWEMENVTVTAHHSGPNLPAEIASFFLGNLARFADGRPLRGLVDREQGY